VVCRSHQCIAKSVAIACRRVPYQFNKFAQLPSTLSGNFTGANRIDPALKHTSNHTTQPRNAPAHECRLRSSRGIHHGHGQNRTLVSAPRRVTNQIQPKFGLRIRSADIWTMHINRHAKLLKPPYHRSTGARPLGFQGDSNLLGLMGEVIRVVAESRRNRHDRTMISLTSGSTSRQAASRRGTRCAIT